MNLVMVVDDKEMMRDSVGSTLRRAGFEVVAASSGEQAVETAARRRPDAVVTDLKMPGMTGMELLDRLRALDDALPVVLMTAFGTIETAVQAIKRGAFDYITKPFEGDELVIAVKRAIAHAKVVRENAVLRAGAVDASATGSAGAGGGGGGLGRLIGSSPAMRRVKEQVIAVAGSAGTVLIVGESGSGKEVVARAVHELSPRTSEAFLAVNCAALSESLLESELFGHEKGAFTGAERLRKGRFELSDRGTLLLDEISEIGPRLQAKLLRVLQERTFERVGSSTPIGVDVRVVATSNRDLPRSVAAGEFRQDLFFRLNVLPIHLPPLRDRAEDIPELVGHFAATIAAREGRTPAVFTDDALALLEGYAWPGNVRELQNICERAVVLSGAGTSRGATARVTRGLIEGWLCPGAAGRLAAGADGGARANGSVPGGAPASASGEAAWSPGWQTPPASRESSTVEPKPMDAGAIAGDKTLEQIEREVIVSRLRSFNGHRQKTARALGIGVRTLGLKLKKWKEQELVDGGL